MNEFWLIAFPYLALVLAIGVGIYRGLAKPYSYSSLSSQLLENRKLFWAPSPGITASRSFCWLTYLRPCFRAQRLLFWASASACWRLSSLASRSPSSRFSV